MSTSLSSSSTESLPELKKKASSPDSPASKNAASSSAVPEESSETQPPAERESEALPEVGSQSPTPVGSYW